MTNEEKVARFITDWQNGKQTFELTTSGSTGLPKNITIHRDQMIASAKKTAEVLGLKQGMTALVCLDAGYIAGMMMVVRSLTVGMKIIVVEPSAAPLSRKTQKIDFAAMVPYQVINSEPETLALVNTIIIGGASIETVLLQKIKTLPCSCYATYGMTETVSHIALQKLNGDNAQENFHTLDGISISTDERSCLIIDVDYLGEKVITNDLVELINAREFKWLGRADNVINSGGIKVIPELTEAEIAKWFVSKGYTNNFIVAGLPHDKLGTQVVLVIEGRLPENEEQKMMEALGSSLKKYQLPRQILYKDQFAYTASGKINRLQTMKN